jgi:hypothetical protein
MSTVPHEYLKAIRKYAHIVDPVAKQYGISGEALLAKLAKGESGFRKNAVSSAGARGPTQFMPATRQDYIRRYGIDPWRSVDEAIHATALYLKSGHTLQSYNPGMPTYTQYILDQKVGDLAGDKAGGGGGGSYGTTTTTTRSTGVDQGARRALLAQYLLGRGNPDSLLQLAAGLQNLPTNTSVNTTTTRTGGGASYGGGDFAKTHSPLKELFWQGAGGIDAKNGMKEPQGFVEGHTDHVHVAAGPKTVVELGRIAQKKFGLHVGENPHFGGVHPVHVANSFHYKGEAIDVSGPPDKMRAFAHYVASLYHIK